MNNSKGREVFKSLKGQTSYSPQETTGHILHGPSGEVYEAGSERWLRIRVQMIRQETLGVGTRHQLTLRATDLKQRLVW